MSDVVVSTTEPVTTVTTVDDVVQVAVTNNVVEVSASTAGVQGASYSKGDPIYVTVRNATGATLAKGTIVYISGSNGNHVQVTPAIATSDATSARTLGWLADDIANNASGLCQVEGYLEGLNTQGLTSGSQLYLSGTVAGAFQVTKPQAPIHLVYVGVVTKISAGDGHVFVKVQNGYELEELHDVAINDPVNNQVLTYDSATDLWVNATNPADGVTSITAVSPLTGGTITSTGSIGLDQTALSITQSQVSNLVTDLAGKANLAGGNSLTGAQTITSTAIGEFPLSIIPASGQTASTFRVRNSANTGDLFSVDSSGNLRSPALINLSTFNNSRISMQNTGVLVDTQIATNVPISVRGASGQTANLMELQTSASALRHRFTDSGRMYSSFSGTFGSTSDNSGTLAVLATSASTIGQVIRGAASQTADLIQAQDSAASNLFRVQSSGQIVTAAGITATGTSLNSFGGNAVAGTIVAVQTSNASLIPLTVRGASGQTANLQAWQDATPAVVASINNAGTFNSNSAFGFQIAAATYYGSLNGGQTARIQAGGSVGTNPHVVVRGVSGATGNLLELQDSAATVLSRFTSTGSLYINTNNNTTGIEFLGTAGTQFISANGNDLGIRPRFDVLFSPADSSGRLRPSNDNTSDLGTSGQRWKQTFTDRINLGGAVYGSGIYYGKLNALQEAGGNVAAFQGRDSQTVDLLRLRQGASSTGDFITMQNSAGTNITRLQADGGASFAQGNATIGSGGIIRGTQVSTNVDYSSLREENSGGLLRLTKQTAAAANPVSGQAKIYLRDGTNAGTLKLVVRAGAAGAETTILDNIPQ